MRLARNLIVGLGSFALLISTAANAIPITSGLQGYWAAEGNALDSSLNSNDGTLVGDATYATGKIGQAFSFDGSGDYVTVPSDTTLDATDSFSIAAWIKRGSTGAFHTIVDRGPCCSDPQSNYLLRAQNNDTIAFEWEQSGSDQNVISTGTVGTDWHHVVGVFDNSANLNLIYIDGVLDNSSATALAPTVAVDSFQIGARKSFSGGFDLFFDGLVDEIAFYDRALSASEVSTLANFVPEPTTGLLLGAGLLGIVGSRRRAA